MNSAKSKLFSKILRGFRHPIRSYKNTLEKHPMIVQSIQTGCLYGTSDLIAQVFCEYKSFEEINLKRTVVFVTTGTFFTVNICFYKILELKWENILPLVSN